ncbi:MAG: metallophosphoesterase family protein [Fibrobacterota bacterium]
MLYILISDIHGNLEALNAVLDDMSNVAPDFTVCLGDIVGYCANPNECAAIVKDKCDVILSGNHDYAALGLLDTAGFNIHAKKAMDWTYSNLSKETTGILKSALLFFENSDFTAVHATPDFPEKWHYLSSLKGARDIFEYFSQKICFVGHTHIPVLISLSSGGEMDIIHSNVNKLDSKSRYIINTGSIGQPRDKDPRASYCIYDSDAGTVEIRRVEYDVMGAQKKMEDLGMPSFLIKRLKEGR